VEDVKAYIEEWKSRKWFGEHERNLADRVLAVLEAEEKEEEVIAAIDKELGVFENKHPWSLDFLLDLRHMVRPTKVEKVEEECTPTEADSPSVLVP